MSICIREGCDNPLVTGKKYCSKECFDISQRFLTRDCKVCGAKTKRWDARTCSDACFRQLVSINKRHIPKKYTSNYRKLTKEKLQEIADGCKSIACMCRAFGLKPAGSNYDTVKKILANNTIDVSHFTGRAHIVKGAAVKDFKDYKVLSINLRNQLVEEAGACEVCGLISEWNEKPLTLQVHHIDGFRHNNEKSNLQVICPNCHSQTRTFNKPKSYNTT